MLEDTKYLSVRTRGDGQFHFSATEAVKDLLTGGGDEEKKEDEDKKDGEEKPDEAGGDGGGGDGDEDGKTEEEVTIEQLQQQIEARQAELDKRLEARRAKEKEERIQTEIVTVIKLEREKLEEERLKLVEERIRQTWRPWLIMLFIIENLLRPITYGILYGHSNTKLGHVYPQRSSLL